MQRLASLGIAGAIRKIPTLALDVLMLGLPYLSIWIIKEAMTVIVGMRNARI